MPTTQALQVFYGTLPLIGAIPLATWNNSKRLDELSNRITDLRVFVDAQFKDVKDRIADLERGSRLIRS
ncbi:MAG: hypothetical protein M3Y24_09630 [Acidobacteriota bacterium]|nr:hypothetical protein [Acidobacteriota bacterium]